MFRREEKYVYYDICAVLQDYIIITYSMAFDLRKVFFVAGEKWLKRIKTTW